VYTSTVRVRHTITCFAAPSDLDLGRSAPPRDMSRFSFRIKTGTRSMIPALVAMGVALILLYGAYESLTSTQVIKISSGSPGGGYYELGTKPLFLEPIRPPVNP